MERKKPREFTEEELKKIEEMASVDLVKEHIAAILGLSDTWFDNLLKKNDSLRLALRLGRARASLKVKTKLWQKIDEGDMKAIDLWMKAKEGYTTSNKLELSGPDGGPMETTEVSKEELKARVLALRKANDLTDDE